eukprot:scaffold130073_cov44-Phaeocystis_antarctica.AAC.2
MHHVGEHTLRGRSRKRRSGRTENRCGTYAACEAGVPFAGLRDAGVRGRPTHRDECESAAGVDRDAIRVKEPGAAADAVAEASRAAAGERGGRPGGNFDTADTVVASVLRCIMGGHAEEELNRRSGRAVCGNRCGPYAVYEAGVPSTGWRDAGVRGRATHREEREGTPRVDRDASRGSEPGAAAGAVEEALGAAAGERGGRPGGDVDTADTVVRLVLRCIMGEHAEPGASQRSAAAGTTSH